MRIISLILASLLVCTPLYADVSTPSCFGTDADLMLHFNGTNTSTTFTDSSPHGHTMTAGGTAQLATAQKEFGTASLSLDGASYATAPDSTDWAFGSGDFTVDFWAYLSAYPSASAPHYGYNLMVTGGWDSVSQDSWWVGMHQAAAVNYWDFGYTTDGATSKYFTTSATINLNTWYHIAIVRHGATLYFFVDGTALGSNYNIATDSIFDSNNTFSIGAGTDASRSYAHTGYIDEVRVVKGLAIWTANFTAPTIEYPPCGTGGFFELMGG